MVAKAYNIQFYLGVLLMLSIVAGCQSEPLIVLEHLKLPQLYVANATSPSPVIDGAVDPEVWDKAQWSHAFIDIEGVEKPKYNTRFKMLWDAENLYLLAQLDDPHIWGNLKQRDTVVFYNNDFEVFIDPDGDTHNYMELEVNALNTVWDLFLQRPYRNKVRADNSWDIAGLQTAVAYQGTINNPTDTDQHWVVEMALPWKSLARGNTNGSLPVNRFWRMNFSRVHWEFEVINGRYQRKKDPAGKFLSEYNWVWSPQGVINMHEPEHWGYVYFSDGSTANEAISLPDDAPLLQWMYSEYTKKLSLAKQNKAVANSATAQWQGKMITLKKETINDTLYWTTQHPFTASTYKIRHDGKLFIKP